MIKRFYLLFMLLVPCVFGLFAQNKYGFEWIRNYQPYYKFKIATTGVYKFDSVSLAVNGINLAGIHPKRFQVFKNGIEQPVYIRGENDGVFNNDDFIEFYGEKNDGTFDTQLYTSPSAQPHLWYSLYSDTAVYFLTILPDTTVVVAKRYTLAADLNFNSYTAEPYFIHEEKVFPANEYVDGVNLNAGGDKYNSSEYTDGEGWADSRIGLDKFRNYLLNTPFLSGVGPQPGLDVKVIGVSDYVLGNPTYNHHVQISVAKAETPASLSVVKDFLFKGYVSVKDSVLINASSIGAGQTLVKMEIINNLSVASDFDQLSYIRIAYPRLYNFGGQTSLGIKVRHLQPGIKSRLTINNYGSGAQTNPRLYDFTTGKRIVGGYTAGNADLLIDKNGNPSSVYVFDSAQVVTISVLTKTDFKIIDPASGYEYIIVTHPKLNSAATDYATYRSQRYNVLKVFSSELYDYYTYGNMHPLAVRRMADHLLHEAIVKPKFLALLGKGYQGNIVRQKQYFDQHLVPVIGVPASDVMLTTGLTGTGGYGDDLPTGRVPAFSNEELNNYLQKLIYYETNSDSIQLWRKNILHLSGGDDLSQQTAFKNQLNAYANIIKGKNFGANVVAYNKNKSDPTQSDLKGVLSEIINKGVSMLTFLGHGSATVIDMSFGSIADNSINNVNKYTFFYFNGCNIGNPSEVDPPSAVPLYGKDFICAPNKGAIGWLAHSNLTLDGKLYTQINAFYNQMAKESNNYGKSVATILSAASKSISTGDIFIKSHCYQLTLLGDPAVKIYSPTLPDYSLEDNDLFIFPKDANAQMDSIAVGVILTNLAMAKDDTVKVTATRTLPNTNLKKTYSAVLSRPLYFKDTLYIWMPVDNITDVGNNAYEVTIDKENILTEITKINNTAQFTYNLPGTGIKTLLPYRDEIVTKDSVDLVVQNNNLFIGNTEYLFELDSTPAFNSPLLRQSGILVAGSIAKWRIQLTSADSSVYFWRSRMNVPENQGGIWDSSSFTLIRNGAKGWSQSHFGQYKKASETDKVVFTNNGIEFIDNFHEVISKQARWWHAGYGILDPYPLTPGIFGCIPAGGIVAVLYNKLTLVVEDAPGYPRNCSPNPAASYYTFDTKTLAGQQEFAKLVDSMETGSYLALYTSYDAGTTGWGAEIRTALGKLGSTMLANANNYSTCGVLVGKKGEAPGMATEDTVITTQFNSQTPNDSFVVIAQRQLQGKWHTGSVVSEKIGPARQWSTVQCAFSSLENAGTDKMWLSVIAVNKNGVDSIIVNKSTSLIHNIASLNAAKYPFVKLKIEFEDSVGRTPNQFGRWMVTYDKPAEGSINPRLGYSFHGNQLQQGDSLKFEIAFENLSSTPFDSLPVVFTITDANRIVQHNEQYSEPALAGNSYKVITKKISTNELSGNNIFSMSVNGQEVQPEVTFNNNFVNIGFEVTTDQRNPMLDVTFDGYRIMSGDFVSPTPVIRLTSKDDNQFKIQKDTTTFNLFIKRPSSNGEFEKINFSSPEVTFVSGTSTNNTAILEYKPQRMEDGDYALRVQSKDATGNSAGSNNYEIDFKVLNESTITNFFPYPNPGTTNIRFVFTLTGSRPPDQLLIRILTITGKVVKEITADEFGPIKIGNNISEFGWNGTDNFGDRLANGVYLYQVFSRIDGQTIKKRDTSADQFVLHNTGKIYLLK
jgi:hypothetical protein